MNLQEKLKFIDDFMKLGFTNQEETQWFIRLRTLQKWLREVKQLHLQVRIAVINPDKTVEFLYELIDLNNPYRDSLPDKLPYINNYEIALEQGLLFALNYIKENGTDTRTKG